MVVMLIVIVGFTGAFALLLPSAGQFGGGGPGTLSLNMYGEFSSLARVRIYSSISL
jgi:hypothetical protein